MFRHAPILTTLLVGAPFVHTARDVVFAPAATAVAPMPGGEVREIDTAAGKPTIKHGPLDNPDIEPTTMVLRVQNPAMLGRM